MEALPFMREGSFSPETSSPQTPFETRTPTTESPPSLSGVNTPDTEYSVHFNHSRGSSPSNSLSEDDFILVVGGFGHIGSHTSWELLQVGKNISIIDNLSNSEQNVLDKLEYLRDSHYKARASWPILLQSPNTQRKSL
jgi:hypothetical protein